MAEHCTSDNSAMRHEEESTRKSPKARRILASLVLLIILFLILVAITSVLCRYYLEMREETSRLNNDVLGKSEEISRLKNQVLEMREEISRLNNSGVICTECPDGWNMRGGSCYYVSEDSTTWEEARDKCNTMSSVLVMVKDKTISDTLNKLYEMNRRYWIGLRRDPENARIWKWLDGTEVTFTNWAEDQPDNYLNRENCGETRPGPWNDIHCDEKLFYICKM